MDNAFETVNNARGTVELMFSKFSISRDRPTRKRARQLDFIDVLRLLRENLQTICRNFTNRTIYMPEPKIVNKSD